MTIANMDPARLPLEGRHLIEASAGTGKTYNMTRIYLRLTLEKELDVRNILVMTFTRAATGELRARIGKELANAKKAFSLGDKKDPFFNYLQVKVEKQRAIQLLERAQLYLDEASIFTIHGFCNRVLSQQAFDSGLPLKTEMINSSFAIEQEVIQDWYRRLAETQPDIYLTLSSVYPDPGSFANNFGTLLRGDKDIRFSPPELPAKNPRTSAKTQVFALFLQELPNFKASIQKKKKQLSVLDFEDMIHQLANVLDHVQSADLRSLLRERYPAALIDEFQDTDPLQFQILDKIYPVTSKAALFLIGDPKQAIYAFRGGDIFAYQTARQSCQANWSLTINWRSCKHMVSGFNQLFLRTGATSVFGAHIPYVPVSASKTIKSTFTDPHNQSAMNLVRFSFQKQHSNRKSTTVMKKSFFNVIATWCAHEINRLLTQGSKIDGNPIQERDIAVLVRNKDEAYFIQKALSDYHYTSVYLSNHEHIFASQDAEELLIALRGILFQENHGHFIAALSTRLFGCTATQLATLQEDELLWDRYLQRASELRARWFKSGLLSMALHLIREQAVPQPESHERSLTNWLHLCEILQQAGQQASQRFQRPDELLDWFQQQILAPEASTEMELRLESEANLIRIMTQHGCKGLEFPIVFIPFSSYYKDPARKGNSIKDILEFHEPASGKKVIVLGGDITDQEACRKEGHEESVRLLYVAVTRAIHRCYLCLATFQKSQFSPTGLLLGDHSSDSFMTLLDTFSRANGADNPRNIHVQHIGEIIPELTSPEIQKPLPETTTGNRLKSSKINRRVRDDWWFSSFSALSRNHRHGGISAPDRDDQDNPEPLEQTLGATKAPLFRFSITPGAQTGNLLHEVLQELDFANPDWEKTLSIPLLRYPEHLSLSMRKELVHWLESCLETPLPMGPKLKELDWGSTLREPEFYFPMNGAQGSVLSALVKDFRGDGTTIELPPYQQLKGMMHGFIDLLFFWDGKYYVVDYKSTYLGDQFSDYSTPALRQNVRKNFYDLQFLIYSLALHRHLEKSMASYDYATHFGGVYYLYLRGMTPKSQTGIFHQQISWETIQKLDYLFKDEQYVP